MPHNTMMVQTIEGLINLNNMGALSLEQSLTSTDENFAFARLCFRRCLETLCQEKGQSLSTICQIPEFDTFIDSFLQDTENDYRSTICIGHRVEGEYDEGMHIYDSTISLNHDCQSIKEIAAAVFYNLGQLSLKEKNNEKALYLFLEAESLHIVEAEESKGEGSQIHKKAKHQQQWKLEGSSINTMALLHNIGCLLYRADETQAAIHTYSKAINLARENPACTAHDNGDRNSNMMTLAMTHNCLGVGFLKTGNYGKALEQFHESQSIYETAISPGQTPYVTPDYASLINNIGRIHSVKGEFDMALKLYQQALYIRRSLYGVSHLDVGATLYNMGQAHQSKGDLERSIQYYQGFLLIVKQYLSPQHLDIAMVLRSMGIVHQEMKDYHSAFAMFSDVLVIHKAKLGRNHPKVANTFNKLGNLLCKLGNNKAALDAYEEGLAIERNVLHSFHPNIAVTLTNMGQLYSQSGEYCKALPLFKEASQIQFSSLGSRHPELSITLCAIAQIHYETKNYSAAIEVYQEALGVSRDISGDDTLEVATLLNSAGLALLKMEKYNFALESFCRSLEIRRAQLGENHEDIATLIFNIGTVHLEMGQDDEALSFYRHTLEIDDSSSSTDRHSSAIVTLLQIGKVLSNRGELTEALKHLYAALKVHEMTDEHLQEHATISKILHCIGDVYLLQGNISQMMDFFSGATRHLLMAGENRDDEIFIDVFWYDLSKLHPGCAPAA